jgi:hypothetical protein
MFAQHQGVFSGVVTSFALLVRDVTLAFGQRPWLWIVLSVVVFLALVMRKYK